MTQEQIEYLALLRKELGALRPAQVLEDARNPQSPLHACFTWDDSEAAEAYRLLQAQAVIRVSVRFLPTPDAKPQRMKITVRDLERQESSPAVDETAAIFQAAIREAEIAVLIHTLTQERAHIAEMMMGVLSGYETELFAIDNFVRGVPMADLVEVVNFSADGETFTESDIVGWVKKYGGHRPRNWSARLAKEEWDADEGANFGAVFGVPAPVRVQTRESPQILRTSPEVQETGHVQHAY